MRISIKDLQVYFWAALHHPEFWTCRINLPVHFRFRSYVQCGKNYAFEVCFSKPQIYISYKIRDAYDKAHGVPCPYEDIPF